MDTPTLEHNQSCVDEATELLLLFLALALKENPKTSRFMDVFINFYLARKDRENKQDEQILIHESNCESNGLLVFLQSKNENKSGQSSERRSPHLIKFSKEKRKTFE